MRARFEVVRGDDGWFARFIAANGREIWRTSETYKRRHGADRAVAMLWEQYDSHDVVSLDERTPPREPWPLEPPYFHRTIRPIVDINTRNAHYGPAEDWWHDSAVHSRNCSDEDCTQAEPPVGVKVRSRLDEVTFTKQHLDELRAYLARFTGADR